MKKMFSSMMAEFTKDMSEEEKKKIKDFGEKMAGMCCSCMNGEEISEEEKKAMKEKMIACCGGTKEMMSAFFTKKDSQPEGSGKSENS